MIYKAYGNTGKKVSALGFGGMRFLHDEYKDGNFEKCASLVREASRLGINYFDTAPFYCHDKSELIFGEAFKDMPNPFYVSTKSGYWEDSTADAVRRRAENSLSRLNVAKINFFHMWCITSLEQYENIMAKGGPYEGALRLKEEGLIDHIVFSTHCNGKDSTVMVKSGCFEGMLIGYNATNWPFRHEAVIEANRRGMGVVTMNPLAGGVIPENAEAFEFLRKGDATATASALLFNAGRDEISVTLSGISSLKELHQNVEAITNNSMFTKDEIETLGKQLKEKFNTFCTGCGYCDHCPEKLKPFSYMYLYNQFILDKTEDEVKNAAKKDKMDLSEIEKCVKCGICEQKCTQRLPIIKRMEKLFELR